MKDSVIRTILSNIKLFFTTNIKRKIKEDASRIAKLEAVSEGLDEAMSAKYHYLSLMEYYALHESEAEPYRKEIEYLRQSGKYSHFPYETDEDSIGGESGFDEMARLPFVVHKGKRLYFPPDCAKKDALECYRYYLGVEKLLGEEEEEGAPHRYQSPRIHVSEGDVVFDIGAAEGLFALDQLDKASHIVVVENNPHWLEPLKHTFAPYGDKVTLIQKYVSVSDSETTISLRKLLSDFDSPSTFVKMDIEGCELSSLVSAEAFLKQKKGMKLAVASYHKQHDAEELKAIFDRLGYYSEFSKGYMLFHWYDTPVPPYFRHGMVRAKNKEV